MILLDLLLAFTFLQLYAALHYFESVFKTLLQREGVIYYYSIASG